MLEVLVEPGVLAACSTGVAGSFTGTTCTTSTTGTNGIVDVTSAPSGRPPTTAGQRESGESALWVFRWSFEGV